MNLTNETDVLDLSDYSDEMRDHILEGLRNTSILPELYGILLWLGGYCGVHRWYLGAHLAACLQCALFFLTCGLFGKIAVDFALHLLPIATMMATIVVLWWFFDLATQKKAVICAQFAKEQRLLAIIHSRLKS